MKFFTCKGINNSILQCSLLFFPGNAKYRSVRGFVDRDERGALAVDGVRCQDPGGDQGHGGKELGAGSQVEREEFLSNSFFL